VSRWYDGMLVQICHRLLVASASACRHASFHANAGIVLQIIGYTTKGRDSSSVAVAVSFSRCATHSLAMKSVIREAAEATAAILNDALNSVK
jgi:hypothetical protein